MLCAASLILAVSTNQKQLVTFNTADSRLLRKLDAIDLSPLVAETCRLCFCPRRHRLPPQPPLQPASFACVRLLVLWRFSKLQLFSCRAKHFRRAARCRSSSQSRSKCRKRVIAGGDASWCICLDLHEAWGGFASRSRRDTGRRSRLSVPFSYAAFKLTRGFTLRDESAATLSKTGPHKHFLFQKIFFFNEML